MECRVSAFPLSSPRDGGNRDIHIDTPSSNASVENMEPVSKKEFNQAMERIDMRFVAVDKRFVAVDRQLDALKQTIHDEVNGLAAIEYRRSQLFDQRLNRAQIGGAVGWRFGGK